MQAPSPTLDSWKHDEKYPELRVNRQQNFGVENDLRPPSPPFSDIKGKNLHRFIWDWNDLPFGDVQKIHPTFRGQPSQRTLWIAKKYHNKAKMNEMRKKPVANEMCSIRFQVFVLLPCDQGPVWLSADKPLLSMLPPHRPACLWCVHKCFFQNHLVLQVMLTYDSVIVMQFVAVGRCACTQAVWLSADWQLIRVRTEVCCHSLPL